MRKAFRKLAKAHHPDRNPGDKKSEERFKRVSAAFDIIGDEEKRKKFDRGEIDAEGHETMRGYSGGPAGGGSPFQNGGFQGANFEGVDLNDILGEMFNQRGGGRGGFERKGADIRARLEIDLEDAIKGATRRISFSDGRVLDVNIPKGAYDGQVLRLKGQGAPGRTGPGDALIELAIRPHPVFHREGDNLVMDLPVSIPDAILGAKVEAQTPEGPVTLTIPKGSNAGSTLRLKGRGLHDPRTSRRGDLMARLMLVLPETIDPDLERFAETWRKSRPYKPRRKS